MKKTIILISAVVFLAVVVSSCHSSKNCPAYSKTETEQTDINS
ncbi:hypothetical protein ACFLTE_03775 [Bacteroidota bacterium]